MDKKDIEGIWRDLIEDYEFFTSYKDTFRENFLRFAKKEAPKILSLQGIATLVNRLYIMLFSFQKDPREELFNLAFRVANFDIEIKKILTQTALLMIRDYIDYLVDKSSEPSRVKKLIELVEIYLSTVEDAYSKYMGKLKEKIRTKDKALSRGERQMIAELLQRLCESESRECTLLIYYKQVPIACRSELVDVQELEVRAKICDMTVFREGKEMYLKHGKLPKTVALRILEVDFTSQIATFEIIGFLDLPQERRRYLRVEPEEAVPVIVKGREREEVCRMADISIGGVGVFLSSPEGFGVGDEVQVSFTLPGGKVEADGVVKHITPYGDGFKMGIAYSLDLKREEVVSDYVMERQFEILRELKGIEV